MTKKPCSIIDTESLEKLQQHLLSNPRIIILAHSNPDGDTFGGAIALYQALKNVHINAKVACIDKIPENMQFIPHSKDFLYDFNEEEFDSVFFIDCGDKKLVKFQEIKPRIISDEMVKVNIDHHPTNDLFGDINFVSLSTSSSAEIIFRILQHLEYKVTPQMATALLLGIYWDTGSFMHQNTTLESYFAASELVKLGGNIPQIAKNVFRSYEFKTLKLWGKVLQNLHITPEGAAIVGVAREDYETIGASRSDLQGVIDFINSIPEAKYAVILSEDEKGNVKASFRTRKPDIDVKALAEKFGGGGHIKASGFTFPKGHLEKEIKWKIVKDE